MTETYSPILHRLDQAVRWRAVHPHEPIPPPYDVLTRYSKPPDELVAQSKRRLEKLVAAADVKKGKIEEFGVSTCRFVAESQQFRQRCKVASGTETKSNPCLV